MKAIFEVFQNGGKPDFHGEHYEFSLMNPFFNPGPIEHPDIPIHLAAVNPYMARLAGELGELVYVSIRSRPSAIREKSSCPRSRPEPNWPDAALPRSM